MIVGLLSAALTFVFLILCVVSYFLYYRQNNSHLLKLARLSFYTASGFILLQAVILMWGLHTHQFQWQYVFSYSSKDLSAYYLTSTFWAGQEGTFLLWLVFGSIYGAFIIRSKNKDESVIMVFMALVQAFIAMILIKKNPFTYLWDLNPMRFQEGVVPLDGNGLNPLLQDPWMVIHPPVLFLGYSSTMILFSFAMAALVTGNYENWIKKVFPYGLFATLILGTGIIMGGYWAYTTLGWGGYWGWDPVENSSLIPWFTSIVFIHGIMIQKRQDRLKKTNIFIALLTFLLVLWGSFLTRSGILSDFSVHSFSETVINNYLIGLVIFFSAIAFITYVIKIPKVKSTHKNHVLFSRGSFMFFGILTLLISAIFTFLGTSSPLLTGIFLSKASNVTQEYYNLFNIPIAILAGFFLAIAPILNWKKQHREKLKGFIFHIVASILMAVVAFYFGLRQGIPLIIFTIFTLVIFINGEIVFRFVKRKNWGFGGYLAHVGIGLMLIGIITSSVYNTTSKAVLPLGSDQQVLGYRMKYMGFRKSEEGKDEAVINVNDRTRNFQATPKFYWSDYNSAYMRNPSVHNLWLKDLYISPIQVIQPENNTVGKALTLTQEKLVYFEDYKIIFSGYDFDPHKMSNENVYIPAILNISFAGEKFVVKPAIEIKDNIKNEIPAKLPKTERKIRIKDINVNDNTLTIHIDDMNIKDAQNSKEMLAVEITEKPLINLLWLGTFLMIGGMVTAIVNRVNSKNPGKRRG